MRRKGIAVLLAAALLTALLPGAGAYTVDAADNTGARSVVSSVLQSAVVKNAQPGKLSVEITLKDGVAANNNVYALVMDTASYRSTFDQGPYPKGLGSGNYAGFSGDLNADGKKSYAIAAGKTGAGSVLTIPLVDYGEKDPATAANKALRVPAVGASTADYWLSYTLVVFDANGKTGNENYYVDRFDLDSEGYVRTPSYMVRYQPNNPAQGSGSVDKLPAKVITRASTYDALGNTTLSGAGATLPYAAPTPADAASKGVPYRVGYAFDGWDPAPGSKTPLYKTGSMDYPKPADDPAKLYQIYDLYAIWSAIPVTFAGETFTAPGAQVGVTYAMTAQTLAAPSDVRSAKTYTVTEAQWKLEDGTLADIDKPGLLDAKKMPAGLKIAMVGTVGNQWNITGTPTVDSDKPIVLTVQVKDNGNATTDTITVTIPVIKKGVQGRPETDWNTALQGRVVTIAEEGPEEPETPETPPEPAPEANLAAKEVGQIIGFYSPNDGAPDYKDKTYEYVPAALYDAKRAELGLGAEDEPTDEQQAALDKLWRAVELTGPAEEDGVDWTGYGTVEAAQPGDWVKGALPAADPRPLQVTDLEVGADFYVRFRANKTYVASDYVTVNTSGAAGGGAGGGGPSISFHLAGGALPKKDDESGEDVDFTYLYDGLSAGETVEIPAVEPVREGYSFAGWTDGANVYKYDPEAESPVTVAAVDGPLTLAARWDATTEGFFSIAIYDWDNSLIGTKLVAKSDNQAQQIGLVKAAFAEIQEEYKEIFTAKAGYDFGCWIPFESDTPTSYGERPTTGNSNQMATEDATTDGNRKLGMPTDQITAEDVTESIALKAAYVTNDECEIGSMASRQYMITPIKYSRFGTSNSYSITLQIERGNVPRPAKPALRVQMISGTQTLYSIYYLEGTDVETIEIVPFATTATGIDSVTWTIVDTYGTSDWVGAGARTDFETATRIDKGTVAKELVDGSMRDVVQPDGYLYYGMLGGLNAMFYQYDTGEIASLNDISYALLRSLGLSVNNSGGAMAAREKLYAAWKKLNPEGTTIYRDLDKTAMQSALDGPTP